MRSELQRPHVLGSLRGCRASILHRCETDVHALWMFSIQLCYSNLLIDLDDRNRLCEFSNNVASSLIFVTMVELSSRMAAPSGSSIALQQVD